MTDAKRSQTPKGIVIAATSSGSGKTTITLGLLRALHRAGFDVSGAKCGPDYIDPRFHEAACHAPCPNLDGWAMSPARVRHLCPETELVIVEGVMGLFDGSAGGAGSTAQLAKHLDLPVILIIDCARMAQSVGAIAHGFASMDPDVTISGVILNNVGSARHERMLRDALAMIGMAVIGAVPRARQMKHPARHLGLVQAQERPDLEHFIHRVADHVEKACDLNALIECMRPLPAHDTAAPTKAPAGRIAIAQDAAFAFAYPHLLKGWRDDGASLSFFSPLADQAPGDADLIYLPGGYPELYAGRLAAASTFKAAMVQAATNGTQIYGECGGYMTLGTALIDENGTSHEMLGLLELATSFAARKLHLGYRELTSSAGPFAGPWAAHEFHYATTVHAKGQPLFDAKDAWGTALPAMGLVKGSVSGSFAHLIEPRG